MEYIVLKDMFREIFEASSNHPYWIPLDCRPAKLDDSVSVMKIVPNIPPTLSISMYCRFASGLGCIESHSVAEREIAMLY